jgi:transketolase
MALENYHTPSALILSRQGIKDLPALKGSDRFTDAQQAAKGAYIVSFASGDPDIILIGNGSEVSTLLDGARLLEDRNHLGVQVVSAISEGLFRQQDTTYQLEVLPEGIPVLGLTAGLPSTLQGLVGTNGRCLGLESFGYSAPYKVLDEKLGFTSENVYVNAIELLEKLERCG